MAELSVAVDEGRRSDMGNTDSWVLREKTESECVIDVMVVPILWTGGYDSTFRICQLSRQEVVIQPYYLSPGVRQSETQELQAIETIRNKLISNPRTMAKINELIVVAIDEQGTTETMNALAELRKTFFLGKQYAWISPFAEEHPGIELSIHKDDRAILMINQYGKLKFVDNAYGGTYILDRERSSKALISLFGKESFPLAEYTKLQMKKEYKQMGLTDLIKYTWFCHTPINGKPCGCCNPCIYTIEEGMWYRLPREAIIRYLKNKVKNSRKYQYAKKICRTMKKPGDANFRKESATGQK